ncbi:MAG TPA: right-handed parallel beta-helix repeat-containing protein [Abditibacteriaceae bacterium]
MKISHWKWICSMVVVAALSIPSLVKAQTAPQMGAAHAPPSSGRVYYVSPTGSDTAEGSKTQPWKTIQKAANTLTAGDSVMIGAGVYRERVAARKSGEAGRPISYIASSGAVMDGLHAPGYHLFDTNEQSYLNISGLKVQNALPEGTGIAVRGSRHVRVERCHTFNTANSGIHVDYSSQVSVLNNEVEKGCQRGGEETVSIKRSEYVEVNYNHVHHTGHEGIDVKEGARYVDVIGNYVHHVERQGLYADAWDKPTSDIRFFNNIVHDCGFGFMLSSERAGLLSDVWFCNNVVYNNAGPGMGVAAWGEEYVTPATAQITKKNLYFINNTIVNNGKPGSPWGGGMYLETTKVDNLVVKNNILSGNSGAPILSRDGKRATNAIIVNNLVFGEGNTNQPGTGNVTGDPLFVNAAKGDFRLRKGSLAINAGVPDNIPVRDKDGRLRDKNPDIGAYEHGVKS